MQVAGYAGLLLATPTVLYEIIAYVVPALTVSERKLLAPIVFGSSILFYLGWATDLPITSMPVGLERARPDAETSAIFFNVHHLQPSAEDLQSAYVPALLFRTDVSVTTMSGHVDKHTFTISRP